MNKLFYKKVILFILIIASLVSIHRGYLNAQKDNGSDDFQWSPTVLLTEGINPYQYQLQGNLEERIILSQRPNYAHGLYILLIPLAVLDYGLATSLWAIFGIFCSIYVLFIYRKAFNLSNIEITYCALLFFCSTPFRNSIGNGQQSLLALLAFSLLLIHNKNIGSFFTGIAYFKYIFAPPIAFYILIARGLKALALSLIPCLIGYIIFFWIVGGNLIQVLYEPLLVAMGRPTQDGLGDLMTIFFLTPIENKILKAICVYIFPILISCYVIFIAIKKNYSEYFVFCVVSLCCLMFYSHRWYDHVFLLPLLAFSIANIKEIYSKIIILIILWNWFGLKILRYVLEQNDINFDMNIYLIIFNFILNIIVLISLFKINGTTYK